MHRIRGEQDFEKGRMIWPGTRERAETSKGMRGENSGKERLPTRGEGAGFVNKASGHGRKALGKERKMT